MTLRRQWVTRSRRIDRDYCRLQWEDDIMALQIPVQLFVHKLQVDFLFA